MEIKNKPKLKEINRNKYHPHRNLRAFNHNEQIVLITCVENEYVATDKLVIVAFECIVFAVNILLIVVALVV